MTERLAGGVERHKHQEHLVDPVILCTAAIRTLKKEVSRVAVDRQ